MQKQCRQCSMSFEIPVEDEVFLDKLSPVIAGKKYSIPTPALCPNCRQTRRMVQTNMMCLYKRKCDATGKDMLSNYHSDSPFKVFSPEYWWGDGWDPLEYGRDFDFSRPFFEQFHELVNSVPRPNLYTTYQFDENSEYVNYAAMSKNCYLIFDCDYCRDTYYSYSTNSAVNCMDNFRTRKCELCYEAIDSINCYNCSYIENCSQCSDSAFLSNCEGMKNSFMCSNLQHKEYYVYNRQATKEEYEALMRQLSSRENIEKFKKQFAEMRTKFPKKYIHGTQNEEVSGDYLQNCKNVHESYDCDDTRDGKYLYQVFGVSTKDAMDCDQVGEFSELIYECTDSGYNFTNSAFCLDSLHQDSNLLYSNHCHWSNNLFGCISLKRKQYCVLNKQYTKEEYEELVPRIIEHMRMTGEWGEFFPKELSTFGYNETHAMNHVPMTKEAALAAGYRWRDEEKKVSDVMKSPADSLSAVVDETLKEIFSCENCHANFKIIPQELEFYRRAGLALPSRCFKCRHQARTEMRNPRVLFDRSCGKCGINLRSTYAPDRPETVLCEKCYLEVVY